MRARSRRSVPSTHVSGDDAEKLVCRGLAFVLLCFLLGATYWVSVSGEQATQVLPTIPPRQRWSKLSPAERIGRRLRGETVGLSPEGKAALEAHGQGGDDHPFDPDAVELRVLLGKKDDTVMAPTHANAVSKGLPKPDWTPAPPIAMTVPDPPAPAPPQLQATPQPRPSMIDPQLATELTNRPDPQEDQPGRGQDRHGDEAQNQIEAQKNQVEAQKKICRSLKGRVLEMGNSDLDMEAVAACARVTGDDPSAFLPPTPAPKMARIWHRAERERFKSPHEVALSIAVSLTGAPGRLQRAQFQRYLERIYKQTVTQQQQKGGDDDQDEDQRLNNISHVEPGETLSCEFNWESKSGWNPKWWGGWSYEDWHRYQLDALKLQRELHPNYMTEPSRGKVTFCEVFTTMEFSLRQSQRSYKHHLLGQQEIEEARQQQAEDVANNKNATLPPPSPNAPSSPSSTAHGLTPWPEVVPVLVLPSTVKDFGLMMHLIARGINVGEAIVHRYVFVTNGPNFAPRRDAPDNGQNVSFLAAKKRASEDRLTLPVVFPFLKACELVLDFDPPYETVQAGGDEAGQPPTKQRHHPRSGVTFYHRSPHNAGVAGAWNLGMYSAFQQRQVIKIDPPADNQSTKNPSSSSSSSDDAGHRSSMKSPASSTHVVPPDPTFSQYHEPSIEGCSDYLLIANADIIPKPGLLKEFCKETFLGVNPISKDSLKHLLVNRFGDFALFAVTKLGYNTLGYFDENLYPAYGEDVEYHIRGASLSKGGSAFFHNFAPFSNQPMARQIGSFKGQKKKKRKGNIGQSGSQDDNHWHISNVNLKKGLPMMADDRINNQPIHEYINAKWAIELRYSNIRDFAKVHPNRYPFDDCRVAHTRSWIRDEGYRRCQVERQERCWWPLESNRPRLRKIQMVNTSLLLPTKLSSRPVKKNDEGEVVDEGPPCLDGTVVEAPNDRPAHEEEHERMANAAPGEETENDGGLVIDLAAEPG